MPNEPVQCPNCGSGDVQQLAADSYTCEHCRTSFRWADPTKITVSHTVTHTATHTEEHGGVRCDGCGVPLDVKNWGLLANSMRLCDSCRKKLADEEARRHPVQSKEERAQHFADVNGGFYPSWDPKKRKPEFR